MPSDHLAFQLRGTWTFVNPSLFVSCGLGKPQVLSEWDPPTRCAGRSPSVTDICARRWWGGWNETTIIRPTLGWIDVTYTF